MTTSKNKIRFLSGLGTETDFRRAAAKRKKKKKFSVRWGFVDKQTYNWRGKMWVSGQKYVLPTCRMTMLSRLKPWSGRFLPFRSITKSVPGHFPPRPYLCWNFLVAGWKCDLQENPAFFLQTQPRPLSWPFRSEQWLEGGLRECKPSRQWRQTEGESRELYLSGEPHFPTGQNPPLKTWLMAWYL